MDRYRLIRVLRLLPITLLIPACVWAWGIVVMSGGTDVADGGDDCSGDLIYSHHMENNDDPLVGILPGCSDSGTYKNLNRDSTASYSVTQKYDGSYSLYQNGIDGAAYLDSTGGWLDGLKVTGCWQGWVYIDGANDHYLYWMEDDGGNNHYAMWDISNTRIRITYPSGSFDDFNDDISGSGSMVTVCWDFGQSAGNDKAKIRIDAGSWQEFTDLTETGLGTPITNFVVLGKLDNAKNHAYVDAFKLADTYSFFD